MLKFFGSQAERLTESQLDVYMDAVEDMSLEAVQQSCKELRDGLVPRNNEFMPTPVELAVNTRRYDRLVADHDARKEMAKLTAYRQGELPPAGMEPAGITYLEVDGRRTDVRDWTNTEQDFAVKTGKTPQSVIDRLNASPLARLRKMGGE